MDSKSLPLLAEALARLEQGFADLPPFESGVDPAPLRAVLLETAERLTNNFPYGHPLYAGQMLKPPHAIARLAYALALWINPNNHALDGGRASSRMEKEAVAALAAMVGWGPHLGHLTGGGTLANLEALWIAGRLAPGKRVAASSQAHYIHERLSGVLGLPFQSIGVDRLGRMDLVALEAELKRGAVGTVVATLGTTALGAVDPLPALLGLRERYGFRLHADAAYGGYFGLVEELRPETRAAYDRIAEVDSIVIDPHKHGLQPYGCGSVLFRDPAVGAHYRHDSPYTYFTSDELHLGEISLECSRPGAAAVALWATQRLLPLVRGGEFAAGLTSSRRAALGLYQRLAADPRFEPLLPPELDIVCWAVRRPRASEISRESRVQFEKAARAGLHLAVVTFPRELVGPNWPWLGWDEDRVTLLRSCLLKPEHEAWLDRIWQILDRVAGAA